jgi:RNA polymerase sigma-70 factor (ECF subfamily)
MPAQSPLAVRNAVPSMPDPTLAIDGRSAEEDSTAWVEALSGTGHQHDVAIERLHALLLRAARFEVSRRQRAMDDGNVGDLDDLAMQAADDALVAIMRKLDTFRGESRFTTWAYKFALLEAAVKVRRRAWQGHEVPLEEDGWAQLPDHRALPDDHVETSELIAAVRQAIGQVLTPHQRAVLVALTLNRVPIDVLADRLGTTRGALYKTLHDARKKLRGRLADDGLGLDYQREGGTL